MSAIVSTEEVRAALALRDCSSVAQLTEDLYVSPSTVRRHLADLIARGQVVDHRVRLRHARMVYALTPSGQEAARRNDPL